MKASKIPVVAVEGCCHGQLDAIYNHITALESRNNYKVDLLLICGDFQAIRNHQDLQCMSVPDKFRKLGDFCKYYTSEKVAPLLTIVIGGNHEASNYMWELYHGGWLAPNIYFLGNAGCVQVNGLRIGGMSGIYKKHDFNQGFFETMPYTYSTMRSIYHIREYNHRRLSLLTKPQIFLSHDWPASIEHHGDIHDLLQRKPFFEEDINNRALGSPPLFDLLQVLKPDWWFSAHLHVKYDAVFVHGGKRSNVVAPPPPPQVKNPDEIEIDDEDEEVVVDDDEKLKELAAAEALPPPPLPPPRNPDEITLDDEEDDVAPVPLPLPPQPETRFIALDKCHQDPRRQFLEVFDIPTDDVSSSTPPRLTFDDEWLAITRAFTPYMSTTLKSRVAYPEKGVVARELEWVKAHVPGGGKPGVGEIQEFAMTAPGPSAETRKLKSQPRYFPNPQTAAFCAMLGIENKIDAPNLLKRGNLAG